MAKLIGTAGHVDHGKTTLIQALTGIDADRLPEEKQRGMTIDIGFAYIDLPELGRVSIVDVPGHERFLSNMLVGALGIDVALLCVAADESVMPQTREHLQILELLPVQKLVVALTRSDLADVEMRSLVSTEIAEVVAQSRFGSAPVVPVAAPSGEGLDALRQALTDALRASDGKAETGPWYLPIDRAFSVKGHGCVVTGTLARGKVKIGEAAFLQPGRQEVRVRSIHVHGVEVPESEAGQRTALNVSGIKLEQVHRGQAIGAADALFETDCIDATVRWIEKCKHAERVRVAIGADEALGKIFLNEAEPNLVQLRLDHPVACALDQPLVVRRHSPPNLLCGGKATVPVATKRRKSDAVRGKRGASDEEAILSLVSDTPNGIPTDEICRQLGKTPQALGNFFERLLDKEQLLGFAGLWFTESTFAQSADAFRAALASAHEAQPTVSAHPRERIVLEARLPWSGKPLDRILAYLAEEGTVQVNGTLVRLASFLVKLTDRQRAFLDRVLSELRRHPVNTPNAHELSLRLQVPQQAVDEVLKLGTQAGELIALEGGVFYAMDQLDELRRRIREIAGGKPFTAGQVRDGLGASRKYVIPLLEYLDKQRFTTRVGDQRMLNER